MKRYVFGDMRTEKAAGNRRGTKKAHSPFRDGMCRIRIYSFFCLVIHIHVDDIELLVKFDFPKVGQFHFVGVTVALQFEDGSIGMAFFTNFVIWAGTAFVGTLLVRSSILSIRRSCRTQPRCR